MVPTMHVHQIEPQLAHIHIPRELVLATTYTTASVKPLSRKIGLASIHLVVSDFVAEITGLLAVTGSERQL